MENPIQTKSFKFSIFVFVFLACSVFAQDNLHHIIIRDAPNGDGNEVGNLTMTADDSITLYAAGYDETNNYIGDIDASWSSTGNLDLVSHTGSSYIFSPNTAPTSGVITATYNYLSDATDTVTVNVGEVS